MVQKWPSHPPPISGESLSSWMCRLGQLFQLSLNDLQKYGLGVEPLSAGCLDVDPPFEIIQMLSSRTGLPLNKIQQLTIRGLVPRIIDTINGEAGDYRRYAGQYSILISRGRRKLFDVSNWRPWLSPHRLNSEYGCIECYSTDRIPHRRLHWRLSAITSCPEHYVALKRVFTKTGRLYGHIKPRNTEYRFSSLINMDRISLQALKGEEVCLPNKTISPSTWFKLLAAILHELTVPPVIAGKEGAFLANANDIFLGAYDRAVYRVPYEYLNWKLQLTMMKKAGHSILILSDPKCFVRCDPHNITTFYFQLKAASLQTDWFRIPKSKQVFPLPEYDRYLGLNEVEKKERVRLWERAQTAVSTIDGCIKKANCVREELISLKPKSIVHIYVVDTILHELGVEVEPIIEYKRNMRDICD